MDRLKKLPIKKIFPIVAALVLLLIIIVISIPRIQNTQTNEGEVLPEETGKVVLEIFSEGIEVKAAGDGDYATGVSDQEILVGATIKTDATGRGQLVYPNGSVTRIDSNSEIVLSKYDSEEFSVKVSLLSGRIWSRVAKLFGKESYQTESENLVATIRGTSYGHEIDEGRDIVTVTKSKVLGECKNKPISQEVETDDEAVFDCGQNQEPLVAPIFSDAAVSAGEHPKEEEDDWLNFNSSEDDGLEFRFGEETYDDIDSDEDEPAEDSEILSATTEPIFERVVDEEIRLLTPEPEATEEPEPTPTPTPAPVIKETDYSNCYENNCLLKILGGYFFKPSSVVAVNVENRRLNFKGEIKEVNREGTALVACFGEIKAGKYYLGVIGEFGTSSGKNTFVVSPLHLLNNIRRQC